MFRPPEVLTEAEVVEAEAELRALRRHALEVVDPKVAQSTTQIIVDGDGLGLQQLAVGQQHPQFLAA